MNPHPPLSAFPLVIVTLLAACEVLTLGSRHSWAFTRHYLLAALAVATPLTFFSGYWGREYAIDVSRDLISAHQAWGRGLLILLVPLVLFGVLASPTSGRLLRWSYRTCLAATFAVAVIASYHGGSLVFDHGAGVTREGISRVRGDRISHGVS